MGDLCGRCLSFIIPLKDTGLITSYSSREDPVGTCRDRRLDSPNYKRLTTGRKSWRPQSLIRHNTKMEMNIMEYESSLRYGCLMYYYCLWCISIHRGYTSNFTEGISKWFSEGLFTWREGAQASRRTNAKLRVKRVFILFFSKHIGFSCQINVF